MNHLQHMGAIVGGVVVTALLLAALPDRDASAAARRAHPLPTPSASAAADVADHAALPRAAAMPVVIIKGKRPGAHEKHRRSLADNA